MPNQYEPLFQPIQIGGIEVKNRFLLAPMEGTAIIDWLFGKGFEADKQQFFLERADDGIGLIIPGVCQLRSVIGNKWLWKNPKVFEPIGPFLDELHAHGAKMFLQLGSGWGRSMVLNQKFRPFLDSKFRALIAKPLMDLDKVMVAPDDGEPNVWCPEYSCRAITKKEIHQYVEAYAKTALLAKQTGFDGVEVHALHEGYLMDQFSTPYTNHRTDEYGGSFENRYRFAVETIQAIKAACGKDFPVSMRYSVVSKTKGFNDGAVPGEIFTEAGRDMAESERAIKYLEDAGYDMFNCDNGTYDCWYWPHPPVYMPLNCNLEEVEHIKQFTSKPVYCAGRMQFDTAADSIRAGRLDGVTVGRQFLTDNLVITKLKEDHFEDIKPCISCHTGCLPMAHFKGVGLEFPGEDMVTGHCALCPRSLAESKYTEAPAKEPKKVAVIGGGIGGMEAAIQCSKRGHTVELYEKTEELGGTFIAAAAPSFKEKDRDLIAWYKRELARHPITVHMNTEIKTLADIHADEYVIATGGVPKSLPIPGGECVITAADWLRGRKQVGDRVAVIGGGITGCEVAYELELQGKHPIVIEVLDDLMKTLMASAPNSMLLRDLLKYHKVPVYLESKVKEIGSDSITVGTPEGIKTIPVDSVIASVGYAPLNDLQPKQEDPHVHVIGDASSVANLKAAIWAANDLAEELSR